MLDQDAGRHRAASTPALRAELLTARGELTEAQELLRGDADAGAGSDAGS